MTKTKKVTRIVRNDDERLKHMSYLATRSLPYTATEEDGEKVKRSTPQNSLLHHYLTEVHQQKPQHSYEEYRGLCKLFFGVPILCEDDPEYAQVMQDEFYAKLSYEMQVKYMMKPIDVAVTREMNKGQMQRYLDAIYHHFTVNRGLRLTQPNEGIYYE